MTVSRKMLAVLVATAVATMWIGVAPASAVPAKLAAALVGGERRGPGPATRTGSAPRR